MRLGRKILGIIGSVVITVSIVQAAPVNRISKEQIKKESNIENTAYAPAKNLNTAHVAYKNISKVVNGKKVTAVSVDMNQPNVKVGISTAGNKVTSTAPIKTMAAGAKLSINGTYFAAYNGDIPLPYGTLVKNGKPLHITDIGSTIGFTSDNKVIIDFVKTRIKGYVNGVETWTSYRINRHTPDNSATIMYTPEHEGNITLPAGWVGVVCLDGKVVKYTAMPRTVPKNGLILVMTQDKKEKYPVGASIDYKVQYTPTKTKQEDWDKVTCALSAGPSLMINGQLTGDPKNESFTEAKILTQSTQRSFIGVTANNQVVAGTVSASVAELKNIVKAMGLQSAMCLDGGASSGLYYNGAYLTSPGRNVNNCINFY